MPFYVSFDTFERCTMRRLFRTSALVTISATQRRVHDRPFRAKEASELQQESLATAKEALLQFNLMIERGVEPDALTYTSLIATMGRAKLEWQAYKLFSRMLEHNIKPMPETYVALRDATSAKRHQLHANLTRKIEESVEEFPQSLATSVEKQQREDDLKCVARFEEYINGDDALFLDEPSEQPGDDATQSKESTSADASYKRVHIRNPTEVWGTHTALEEAGALGRSADGPTTDAHVREELSRGLSRMDEEELRIFLTVKKQFRHGTKDELVGRIVQTVGALSIREMLKRRSKYFKAVGDLLELDLKEVKEAASSNDVVPTKPLRSEAAAPEAIHDVMQTPWGFLHRPKFALASRSQWEAASEIDVQKLERVQLTQDELSLIHRKSQIDELDDVPMSMLRRYAFQYQLRWRRHVSGSLADIVSWHAKTILPSILNGSNGVVSATPSLRRQLHESDMRQTLENFEAFRIISQRTKNLQVVDSKEINLHIKRAAVASNVKEHRAEVNQRRERHIKEASALQRQAREFMPVTEDNTADNGASRILGSGQTGELPPWALESDSGNAFNFKTKRFGDPNKGFLQELSDGKFRTMPNREAQTSHHVELNSLEPQLRDSIQHAQLTERQVANEKAAQLEEKLTFRKFKKFNSFIGKAKLRQQAEKESAAAAVQPSKSKLRMVNRLRRGQQSETVSKAAVEKFFASSL